jgi:hypothetical protein
MQQLYIDIRWVELQDCLLATREPPFMVGLVDGHTNPQFGPQESVLQSLQANHVHSSCKNFILHTHKHTEKALSTSTAVCHPLLIQINSLKNIQVTCSCMYSSSVLVAK